LSKKGKLIILTAPSGSGKSTIAGKLLNDFENIAFSVSATTRQPRKDETDGLHYHFISEKEFKEKISHDEFLEWEQVYDGTYYGTLRSDIENLRNKGYFTLLDIDVKGALNIKQQFKGEALGIFIKPPSIEVLEQRLKNRGTDSERKIRERLKKSKSELLYAGRFDHVVVNEKLDKAYGKVKEIVEKFMNRTK